MLNVKGKLNNMEYVQTKYWEMDIWKVYEFNSLNEEAEEFTRMRSQNLLYVRSPKYLKQKPSNIVHET